MLIYNIGRWRNVSLKLPPLLLLTCQYFTVYSLTGAQLRHNDFRIFNETFKTTSQTLSENMQGQA